MPYPIQRPSRLPHARERRVFFLGAVVAGALSIFVSSDHKPFSRRPQPRAAAGMFEWSADPAGFPEFEIDVAPEFLRALDAAVPKDVECRKVRYKKVPIERLAVNGRRVPGRYTLRYRGYCKQHWAYGQKSFKIESSGRGGIRGYRTLNLNTLDVDPFFYENWANHLLYMSGGVSSRVRFARLTLNGEALGLRAMSENLDADLIKAQGLPKGALYRERTHVALGKDYGRSEDILEDWKKNALARTPEDDLFRFNAAIRDSVRTGGDEFLHHVNVAQYVNYSAVATITGTRHFDDHNIPFYRPAGDGRFIPVGYDFGWNAQGKNSGKFEALQVPYMSLNWLSQLFWGRAGLRHRIHRRIAEILADFPNAQSWYDQILESARADLKRGFDAGRILDSLPEVSNIESYNQANTVRPKLRKRLEHLRRAYLDPVARISPDWRRARRFQLMVEGAGAYSLRVKPGAVSCGQGQTLRVRVHTGPWKEALLCDRGRMRGVKVLAERNDIGKPTLYTPPRPARNSIGGILLDVENPQGLALEGIEIKSLQTSRSVPLQENWPLSIQKAAAGSVTLGRPPLPMRPTLDGADGFRFIRLPRQAAFWFDAREATLRLKGEGPRPEQWDRYGPVLCWNLQGRPGCYEFHHAYAPLEVPAKGLGGRKSQGMKRAGQSELGNCGRFVFTRGDWSIEGSIQTACAVRFLPGARLFFERGAYMVLKGSVAFPAGGEPVVFSAKEGEWGGVIIESRGRPCRIQNGRWSRANEFRRGPERYTAALTVVSPGECLVRDNVFSDNYGDDALNIRGGKARIYGNLFSGNRDALDLDGVEAEVADNLFLNSKDDGIDLGGGRVRLSRNMVRGCGDKGISIGEGAEATVAASVLEGNNVGIAVKEGARARLSDVVLAGNEIGISIYRGPEARPGVPDGKIEGSAALIGNRAVFQRNGEPEEIGLSAIRTLNAPGQWREQLAGSLLERCPVCRLEREYAAN